MRVWDTGGFCGGGESSGAGARGLRETGAHAYAWREGRGSRGDCTIEVPFSEGVTQQERYFHGAVIGAVGDNAGGYAALTLAPPDREVLTVEYKVNFLAPAFGEKLVAHGEVVTAGRRLFVCKAEVSAVDGDEEAGLRGRVADRLALARRYREPVRPLRPPPRAIILLELL